MSVDETTPEFSFAMGKDFIVLVPLIGSALAITFDVGYFVGIDINFFTFFSLSEHVVFAFEVFPAALFAALCIAATIYFKINTIVKSKPAKRIAAVVVFMLFVFCVGLVAVFEFYAMALGATISGLLLVIATKMKSLLVRVFLGYTVAAVLAYALGYSAAVDYLQPSAATKHFLRFRTPSNTIETKSDGKVDARIIRSGDRGVLFFDEKTKQVNLLRWDEIKQISTAQAPK